MGMADDVFGHEQGHGSGRPVEALAGRHHRRAPGAVMNGSLRAHRQRLIEAGLRRLEVHARPTDAQLIRHLARSLARDDREGVRLRRALEAQVPGGKGPSFKEWLASAESDGWDPAVPEGGQQWEPGIPGGVHRRVVELADAGGKVGEVAESAADLAISDQAMYTWLRQDRTDRGLEAGWHGRAGRACGGPQRIRELGTELTGTVSDRAVERPGRPKRRCAAAEAAAAEGRPIEAAARPSRQAPLVARPPERTVHQQAS